MDPRADRDADAPGGNRALVVHLRTEIREVSVVVICCLNFLGSVIKGGFRVIFYMLVAQYSRGSLSKLVFFRRIPALTAILLSTGLRFEGVAEAGRETKIGT